MTHECHHRHRRVLAESCGLAAASHAGAGPTTQVKPGFNVFSAEQDVEIGRQSAAEAERQLPLLNDRSVDGYVNGSSRAWPRRPPGRASSRTRRAS